MGWYPWAGAGRRQKFWKPMDSPCQGHLCTSGSTKAHPDMGFLSPAQCDQYHPAELVLHIAGGSHHCVHPTYIPPSLVQEGLSSSGTVGLTPAPGGQELWQLQSTLLLSANQGHDAQPIQRREGCQDVQSSASLPEDTTNLGDGSQLQERIPLSPEPEMKTPNGWRRKQGEDAPGTLPGPLAALGMAGSQPCFPSCT